MLFSWEQVAGIRRGKVTAVLVPRSERPTIKHPRGIPTIARPIRKVRREIVERDGEGIPTGKRLIETMSLEVTITAIEPKVWVADLGESVARACGYQTVEAMRAEWRRRHPRLALATLIYFEVGDTRNAARFLTATPAMRWDVGDGRGGTGDYTGDRRRSSDDVEALSEEQLDALAAANRQKDVRRKATTAKRAATAESDAQRLARIEAARAEIRASFSREWNVIEDRLDRIEGRLRRQG